MNSPPILNRLQGQIPITRVCAALLIALIAWPCAAQAQCANSMNRAGTTQANNGTATTNTNFANGGFGGLGQQNGLASQMLMQQLMQAQLQSFMQQRSRPQPPPPQRMPAVNRSVNQDREVRRVAERDPDRPLTEFELRVEKLKQKEELKRQKYAERIAERDAALARLNE